MRPRPCLLLAAFLLAGCAGEPTRTPPSAPVEPDEATPIDGEPLPTIREGRRIETH